MVLNLIYVALGGALGAVLRYLTGLGMVRLVGSGFPAGTLLVNILGSFLMGAFAGFALKRGLAEVNPMLMTAVMTGVLGGFTTFSAFSLETVTLFERGASATALAYVLISVLGSILALALGLWCARGLWA